MDEKKEERLKNSSIFKISIFLSLALMIYIGGLMGFPILVIAALVILGLYTIGASVYDICKIVEGEEK